MIKVNNFPKIDVVILAGGKGSRIKKLLNGSYLDGEGGSTVWGKLIPAKKSLKLNALPIGLANKLKLKNDIVEGNIITWHDVEFNINDETISYRKKMENQIKD